MDEKTDARPLVRCLVVHLHPNGQPKTRPQVMSLGAAYLAMCEGAAVVGPDPDDEIALATWERDRAASGFNRPRME